MVSVKVEGEGHPEAGEIADGAVEAAVADGGDAPPGEIAGDVTGGEPVREWEEPPIDPADPVSFPVIAAPIVVKPEPQLQPAPEPEESPPASPSAEPLFFIDVKGSTGSDSGESSDEDGGAAPNNAVVAGASAAPEPPEPPVVTAAPLETVEPASASPAPVPMVEDPVVKSEVTAPVADAGEQSDVEFISSSSDSDSRGGPGWREWSTPPPKLARGGAIETTKIHARLIDPSSSDDEDTPAVAAADTDKKLNAKQPRRGAAGGDDDDEDDGPVVLRTKNELAALPPVEPVKIEIPPDAPLLRIGTVKNVIGNLVIIESLESGENEVLDADTVLIFDDRVPLGKVIPALPRARSLISIPFSD
ncbi:hypothetical protein BDK51DRAFT_46235 [Blyttiomyces helicus]|uniref:Uncharacterized protein n=1 Tax=Blyttiomyces helicus TaxID=388810 RepID=A0A4P9W245_9FUNG|nr:hypothetical protein BDK51DRAFT_46235 [Blyttiomyces helicus]|eukprot:RKO86194.1 hypothetical protein BDK51DRAFT_46235 [Blyttiomyces helicus]